MKRQIEIFTSNCPICESVVELVKTTAGENCEIILHDISQDSKSKTSIAKMEAYKVKRIPTIIVDGKLLSCCSNLEITKDSLVSAGIGQC